MKYLPGLDGIRAVAVLGTLLFHARVPYFEGSYIGVDAFFVLSGFLITSLLMAEIQKNGKIAFLDFYMRRFFRLMPALLLLLLFFAAASFYFPTLPQGEGLLRDLAVTVLYLTDFSMAYFHFPAGLSHTWSLSVEEHYYILWPLAVTLLCRKLALDKIVMLLGGLYMLATMWRILAIADFQTWALVYYRPDTHCSGLILGSFLAALARHKPGIVEEERNFIWLGICMIITTLTSVLFKWPDLYGFIYGVFAVEMATFLLILYCLAPAQNGVKSFLSSKPLVYVGKISYGLYLYHFPIIYYMSKSYSWQMIVMTGFPVVFACAAISYHFIEKPIVNWSRQRFAHLKPALQQVETP